MLNHRWGWVVGLSLSGALVGCGDALHDVIDELAHPPSGHSAPSTGPSAEPPRVVDAGSEPSDPPPLPDPPPPVEPPPPLPDPPPPVEPPPPLPDPPPPVEPPAPPAPSFEADVWPIFMSNCTPCHTTGRRGGHSVGSPVLATAFADATRLGPTLIVRLDGGGMPPRCTGNPGDPGCIAIADLATIQLWIDTGMAP